VEEGCGSRQKVLGKQQFRNIFGIEEIGFRLFKERMRVVSPVFELCG
jgi:hypothetical protein